MKIDGGSGKRAEPVMLSEVAERLHNPRIDRIVASFREYHVSLMRTVVLGFVVIWSAAWLQGPAPMAVEAHRVVPVAAALFVLSTFWMLGIRAESLRQNAGDRRRRRASPISSWSPSCSSRRSCCSSR